MPRGSIRRVRKSGSKLLDFIKKDVASQLGSAFQFEPSEAEELGFAETDNFAKILVVPGLPTTDPHRSESVELLKEAGVSGIISFSTIPKAYWRHVEPNHSYAKSELLQLIRVLKVYDMVRDPQMSLFG